MKNIALVLLAGLLGKGAFADCSRVSGIVSGNHDDVRMVVELENGKKFHVSNESDRTVVTLAFSKDFLLCYKELAEDGVRSLNNNLRVSRY